MRAEQEERRSARGAREPGEETPVPRALRTCSHLLRGLRVTVEEG